MYVSGEPPKARYDTSVSVFRAPILILFALIFGSSCFAQINIQLSPESQKAFDDYVKTAESQMNWQARFPAQAKPGELTITASGKQSPVDAPAALIHDWTAAMLVPGGTAEKALKVMQSYNDYKTKTFTSNLESRNSPRKKSIS